MWQKNDDIFLLYWQIQVSGVNTNDVRMTKDNDCAVNIDDEKKADDDNMVQATGKYWRRGGLPAAGA